MSQPVPNPDAIAKANHAIQELLDSGTKPTLRAVRQSAGVAASAAAEAVREWNATQGERADAEAIPESLNVRFLAIWNEARREAHTAFQATTKEFQAERAELHADIDALTAELATATQTATEHETELAAALAELAAERDQHQTALAEIAQAQTASASLRLENAKLAATTETLEKQLAALQANFDALLAKITK
ncbi:MAG: DNA-binding protein [Promicromonosporaceae bacterium]|nr:DNA-binding protein [Promicromonosporaceae bacterium]